MSKNTKYLKEEDLSNLDKFIQDSLKKYFYVDVWDKLYSNTGKNYYDIISIKSTIPDLVIYNKTFNKNDCFFHSNKKSKYIKFPRIQFLLRPRRIKYYNPSDTYGENKEEENLKKDVSDSFEFKSIPKEIEDKYNINNEKNTKKEKNVLLDELQDFMKSDNKNTNENKVKLIKENENISNKEENKKKDEIEKPKENKQNSEKIRNFSKKENYYENKFEAPMNLNNLNQNINYNMNNFALNNFLYYQKMIGLFQYRNLYNSQLSNASNTQMNKFNQNIPQGNKDVNNNNSNNSKISDNNNSINNNGDKNSMNKSNNNAIISYYDNKKDDNKVDNQKKELEKLINNMDDFIKKNINRRGWKVLNIKKNFIVGKFNNEQLFLFLNTIISRNEDKFYSINDDETDVLFNPLKIYEDLKKVYQK